MEDDPRSRSPRSAARPAGSQQHVAPFELFFDLVFVFAVMQLSHRLVDDLTQAGIAQTLLLLVVWSAWVTTTWLTNWLNPDLLAVRLVLVWVMLASLSMSAAIPDAFGDRALTFALAIVAIHVGRAGFAFLTLRASLGKSHPLTRTYQRTLTWHLAAGLFWIAGGLLDGRTRYLLWGLALTINYAAPLIGYWIPGLGASRTQEWMVQGMHLAERCRLFIIIALGESLLVTGATFAGAATSTATTAAFVVAFVGSVALWWIYFHRSAEAASRVITAAADPGRLARSAYTYLHLPMVAGIIAVAAADELTVAHPGDRGTPASVALTLGGTMLFLAGHGCSGGPCSGNCPGRTCSPCWCWPSWCRWPDRTGAAAQRDRMPGPGWPCGVGDIHCTSTAALATPVNRLVVRLEVV